MNLWTKALKLVALVVLPTLFFVACDEELNNVGENISGNSFEILYKEFVLPSHVLIDSVRTNRINMLVGNYTDPEMGVVNSEAYLSITSSSNVDLSASNIVFDSMTLSMKLTPYYYGGKNNSDIEVSIHKLTEAIEKLERKTNFHSQMYDADVLGEYKFTIAPATYDKLKLGNTDTLKVKFSNVFVNKIATLVRSNSTAANDLPSKFSGFVFTAKSADKVFGMDAKNAAASKFSIHYHTESNGKVSGALVHNYTFVNKGIVQGYNRITSDLTGTAIAGLNPATPRTPVTPSGNLRYLQEGTGITTEVDFEPFITFFKGQKNVVLNSVGISLNGIQSVDQLPAVSNLLCINTDENSKIANLTLSGQQVGRVLSDDFRTNLQLSLRKNSDGVNGYLGLPTRYFQLMKDQAIKRSTIAISSLINGSTVNRFVIHQDSIKLKVYYTIPK